MSVLANWGQVQGLVRVWTPEVALRKENWRVVAPLTYPNKVICAGANYRDHLAEMGLPVPSSPVEPFFFLKAPTTTVIGPGAAVPMPVGEDVRLDFEAEFGVVIGRAARDVEPWDAMACVAGYVVANDISARGHFRRADPLGPPFAFDWIGHKSQDGFCPIGPALVPRWQVPDPQRLGVRTWVNGKLRQDSSTSGMLVPIDEQISALSRRMTLEPGDLILTGTPAGVGAASGEFLEIGDEIRIEIEEVGVLSNHVGPPPGGAR
jgi:2-keto-4-pentenoate hydratase/2-oxohepta-3-ene-1,7-dioic acid hydratase in catechol pathway